jgi:hypothetical protein
MADISTQDDICHVNFYAIETSVLFNTKFWLAFQADI